MKNYDKEIGEWLAHQRESRGLTQGEVGDMLGVTKVAVHYWETGKRKLFASALFDYCSVLGVDPQDLVEHIKKVKENERIEK